MGAKWTRGEIAGIGRSGDRERMAEVLGYLDERGPEVVDWDDDRERCEECEVLGGHTDACESQSEAREIGEQRAGRASDTDIEGLRGGL